MAKLFVLYTNEDGLSQAEDFFDGGEACDRADWLAESKDLDPELKIEYRDGQEFKYLDISFDTSTEGLTKAITIDDRLPVAIGETCRDALIALLEICNNIEKQYALMIAEHKRWYNDRRKEYFEIVGVVRSCETANWELLYKKDGATNEFFRRPAWEWLGSNRDGNPRFSKVFECQDDFCAATFRKPEEGEIEKGKKRRPMFE